MADIGLVGLGTMGAALALNIAERGYDIAVHNRTVEKIGQFVDSAGELASRLTAAETPEALVASLSAPRSVILMVPAGAAVDATIDQLIPLLDKGDTLVDAGNADFNDTRRREAALAERGLNFIGMGVSGGEDGARHGPSIMVGGPEKSYAAIREIVEAIAADYQGSPCAAWLGPDGAGHFVKTVHNGIEYADMQMIAEVYGLLRDGEGKTPAETAPLFERWNEGKLRSYLIEITAEVLRAQDKTSGGPLLDVIRDSAGQKGTGRWTVIEALKLGQSASAIESAVAARSWSSMGEARAAGESRFGAAEKGTLSLDDGELEQALLAARIIAYGQGLALLQSASEHFDWSLDLGRVAEIWRAGCIIRSDLLDDISQAAREGLPHGLLTLAPAFADRMETAVPALRRVVLEGLRAGLPMPAMSSALAWFDTMRQSRGSADLIQGQRDFFGRHGFERTDNGLSDQHGPWAD
ncbi:6-phosphogluconate dehydrogenase [Tranquillimonas rosea]|uniref:6-phosphogluconate dehydrogenase, decarboxylating n=1 Tax=Tranquillimonas rosea TaxID=641238 RepID=A0A1H9RN34_9RHOB|nr:NADP-dependent phosphogluconate dehydrogenase [Tranquillimonas rosea]SER74321.1 6-phosphogluconate dehydrogenase [Tranquillimonas rosea]